MWCQSRNRRPSATSCFQRPTSYAFHQPHPSAHRTSSYPEDSSHLSLRKTFLNCLNDSPPKVFLSFRRQRASILVSHARQTNTLFSDCHLYYAPISNSEIYRCNATVERPVFGQLSAWLANAVHLPSKRRFPSVRYDESHDFGVKKR